jgi:hypothetical protein
VNFCEEDNENSGSIKNRELLGQLNNYQLLKNTLYYRFSPLDIYEMRG